MESEITYEYKDFLENGMKFTAYRNTFVGESTVHKHNFLELIYVISGSAVHYIDDTEYKVTKGDLLLIDTDQTHFHKSETGVLFADMVLLPEFISENLYHRLHRKARQLPDLNERNGEEILLVPRLFQPRIQEEFRRLLLRLRPERQGSEGHRAS